MGKEERLIGVYSEGRLEELAKAINTWLLVGGCPRPLAENAPLLLGVAYRTICSWRKCKYGPGAQPLWKLYQLTKNSVFLLTSDELERIERKKPEVPDELRRLSLLQSERSFTEPEVLVEEQKVESSLDELESPTSVLHLLLISVGTIFSSMKPLSAVMEEIPSMQKEKAVELILLLVKIFRLKLEDFQLAQPVEPDAETRKMVEGILLTLFGDRQ